MVSAVWQFSQIPKLFCCFCLLACVVIGLTASIDAKADEEQEVEVPRPPLVSPSVMIAVLVRNKQHALPWFLAGIENLLYPKDRISLWIRVDHCSDKSADVINQWLKRTRSLFHSVDYQVDNRTTAYDEEIGPLEWPDERFTHVIQLRQAALSKARKMWADYLFMLDADNILVNRKTLNVLMEQDKTVIAPMMNCSAAPLYSNFWGKMSHEGYYKRSANYVNVVKRFVTGIYKVPMVHSAFLINLNHKDSRKLSYDPPPPNYIGPHDDIIRFAFSAKYSGVKFHVINSDFFGYLPKPLREEETLEHEQEMFIHLKMEASVESEGTPLASSKFIKVAPMKKDRLGFDKIYVINLLRRPERRKQMIEALNNLGIEAEYVDAVDGKQLNETYLNNLGVKILPNFADPHSLRAMTYGEIGCFLSHYNIWQDVVKNNHERILVLEDDCRFEALFRSRLAQVLNDAAANKPDWDLMYLGRKILQLDDEEWVPNADHLIFPQYSYWTIAYALTLTGAKKLFTQQPLSKLVPVDEYLPIMYDKHPTRQWKLRFWPRDLVTISTAPLLVHPTHYTGQKNYISDTEMSKEIDEKHKGRASDADEEEESDEDAQPEKTRSKEGSKDEL